MLNKLTVALALVLAVTAQAGHVKHHHARRNYADGYGSIPQNSTSVAPQSTPSASPAPISTGTAPVGPGSSASPSLLSSSIGLSASLLPSSSNPPSTASGASLVPSSSIPRGTGPIVPPFPVSSGSLSASQNPSSTVPLGTGVTGAPAKVSLVTSDSVLTYTIGTGSSTTIIVTTVRHTRTSTIVKTIFATKSSAGGELAATNAPESPVVRPRPTSTKRIYVTSTAVITVYPVPSETPSGSEKGAEGDHNYIKGVASNCAAQVTITVPGPEVTVTVTATPPAATPSGAGEEGANAPTATPSRAGEGGVEAPTASALPSLSSSVLFNNGTEAATRNSKSKTKTKCASTGFLTRTSAAFTAQPSATGIYNPY